MPPFYPHHLPFLLLFIHFCSAMMPFPQNGGAPMMNNQGPPMQQPFGAPVPAGGSLRARTMSGGGGGGPQPKRLADYEWLFQVPPNVVSNQRLADGRLFEFDSNVPGFVVDYNGEVWEFNPQAPPYYYHMDANGVLYNFDGNNGLFIPQVPMQQQQLAPQAMPPFQQQQPAVFGNGMQQQQPMMAAGQSGNFGVGGVPGMPQQQPMAAGGLGSFSLRNRAAGGGSGHSLRSSSISKRTQFFAATAGTETMRKWQQGKTKILDSSIPSVVLEKHKKEDDKGLVMIDGKLKRIYRGHVNTQRIFVSTERVQGDVMRKTKQR